MKAAIASAIILSSFAGASAQSPAPSDQAAATAKPNLLDADESTLLIGEGGAGAAGTQGKTSSSSGIWAFFQMILVLALVLGCIYGVLTFIKRIRRPVDRDAEGIRVLARASLAPGRSVHVLKAGSRAWLIGASEGSVSLISELDDKELIDRLELEADKEIGKGPDFRAILANLLPNRAKAGKRKIDGGFDFLSSQKDRLKKL